MGIGGSKPNGTAVPTKLTGECRPLFRLRRRRCIIKTLSTISTQELLVTDTGSLMDCASSPSHSFVCDLDRSASSPAMLAPAETTQACSQAETSDDTSTISKKKELEETAVNGKGNEDEHDHQMISKEDTIGESSSDKKQMPSPDDNVDGHEKEDKENADKDKQKVEEEEEEEEEEEDGGWVLGIGDMPSSPSFREYCRFSFPDPNNASDDGKDSFADAESFVTVGSTGSGTTSPVKTPRRSVKERFRRLRILSRGPNAISNLLSLRSCYNHTSNTSDDPEFLSVKSGS